VTRELLADLGPGPVAIDTPAVIYFIERHPEYLPIVRPLFVGADAGALALVTSGLTLLEVLVVPLRAGRQDLAARYEALLTRSRGLRLASIGPDQLRAAAFLRARFPALRTPDALQLSAALTAGCSAFVTNDRRLPAIPGLRILQVDDYRGG